MRLPLVMVSIFTMVSATGSTTSSKAGGIGMARAAGVPHVSTAFFYGPVVPRELTRHFERLVVDVDNLKEWPRPAKAELFAYLSVGEIGAGRPWRKEVPEHLVLGHNRTWGSAIVDTGSPAWREFLLSKVIPPLRTRGVRGLFLDALDSFEQVTTSTAERSRHERGIADLVDAIRTRFPELKILLNRGFGVLPLLARPPDGLVVESLFHTGEPQGATFGDVPEAATTELLQRLHAVRNRFNLPIAVIDYAPVGDRVLCRALARRILAEGFDPYITMPLMDVVGIGRVEIVRRRILVVYRSTPGTENVSPPPDAALAAPILEWLGYAVDYADERLGLPAGTLVDRYAGIVVLSPDAWGGSYARWVLGHLEAGLHVAFLGGLGFAPDQAALAILGLAEVPSTVVSPLTIAKSSWMVGFESTPQPSRHELPPFATVGSGSRSELHLTDAEGHGWDAVVIGPWGGAAFSPYVVTVDLDDGRRWILDPFRFFTEALALEAMPAPDVSTESGRRILTAHIDGDGFVSRSERLKQPYAGQVILDEILRRHPFPHTVSVIEGELGRTGIYPSDSERTEAIAREIFRLPYVEAASHTFSHPFTWSDAEAHRRTTPPPTLPIPGYGFSAEREIAGSIAYINDTLLPRGKTVQVLLWSGDSSPSGPVVAVTERLGVANVNGGGATRTADHPSLTRASPLGEAKGGSFQVFAPVQNENVFTNGWHGPFYGFEHAIEAFTLTGSPRRFGPISLYYHFFSGTKTASLVALKKVYDWAERQETTRLFLSEYASKVRAFQSLTLGRRVDDGAWEVGGAEDLRTLRLDPEVGWPALEASVGVAGFRDEGQLGGQVGGRYVHLARDAEPILALTRRPPIVPYLLEANGRVLRWVAEGGTIRLHLAGHEPLRFSVGNARRCVLRTALRSVNGRPATMRGPTPRSMESTGWATGSTTGAKTGAKMSAAARSNLVRFALDASDSGEATLACR
jgi:hypothetical protein